MTTPTTSTAAPGLAASRTMSREAILGLVASDLLAVEDFFSRQMQSEIPIIGEMGGHLLSGGGKRLRPALHLLAARAAGGAAPADRKRVVLATVFELIHTATLVHDDVIDGASTRRGRPSLNATRGNTITVLMGDHLYLKSVILTLQNEDLEVLRLISAMTAKMIEGELLQVVGNGNLAITEEDYLEIVRRKTAYLFAVCCQTAGMLVRAPEETCSALYAFGLNLGMAFQLVDDLLDFTADESVLGKPVLSDFREGKVTLPVIHALKEAGASRHTLEARLRLVLLEGDFISVSRDEVSRLVRDSGGLAETGDRAAAYASLAADALRALPASEARTALAALPDYVIHRDK